MKEPNRVRKNPIKYNVQLDEEQKKAKEIILQYPITVITGQAGSGKSMVALLTALDFVNQKMGNLILTRTLIEVGDESMGFLPGPQPLSSKILTPFGWNTMENLNIGDYIIGKDGKTYNVLDKSSVNFEDIYKVSTTDGREMFCSLYHLFHTLTYNDKKHRLDKRKYNKDYNGSVKTLKEIIQTFKNNKNKLNHYLPYNDPIEFKDITNKYIHPYLLGVILGDGCITDSVSFSNIDQELIQRCIDIGREMNITVNKVKDGISYTLSSPKENNKPAKEIIIENIITKEIVVYKTIGEALKHINLKRSTLHHRCNRNSIIDNIKYSFGNVEGVFTNPVKEELRILGLEKKKAIDKFIPKSYIYNASIQDRIELLRGLMDTDGTVDGKTAAFTTISKQLALDVIELVHSLGGRAKMYTRNRIGKVSGFENRNITTRYISYEICINLKYNPFYISRKRLKYNPSYSQLIGIKNIEKIGKDYVQCLKTSSPDGLYITNNYIVTHNSASEKLSPYLEAAMDNLEKCMSRPEILKLVNDNRIVAGPVNFMRGKTVEDVLIVEEGQNLTIGQMLAVLTRTGKTGKIIITGDLAQKDRRKERSYGALDLAIDLAKDLPEYIGWVKLNGQHRHDVVSKINDLIYSDKYKNRVFPE